MCAVTGGSDSQRGLTAARAAIPVSRARTARLWFVFAANLALVGALVGVGITAHSLGVLAEGADYLGDAAAIGVSLVAIHLSARPATPAHPDGYPRATRFAALVNAGWLLILCMLVAAGALDRLITGTREVQGLPVLVVSAVAAVVMVGGALLLGGDLDDDDDGHDALNIRAVLLDTAADAVAAAGVAVTGAVILIARGLYWLDPAVALVIAVVVGYHAAQLLGRIRRTFRY
jgi:cobalt-zinc-cadmium efflux system protein